ncbi:hypothetical protein ACEPPN_001391 [Leptodophora sp. 'Broadleaf-Isolate-01']
MSYWNQAQDKCSPSVFKYEPILPFCPLQVHFAFQVKVFDTPYFGHVATVDNISQGYVVVGFKETLNKHIQLRKEPPVDLKRV